MGRIYQVQAPGRSVDEPSEMRRGDARRVHRRAVGRQAFGQCVVFGVSALALGCASASPPAPHNAREVIMMYDDAHASGTMAFPSATYESVVRFQLPEGEHKPIRLRFQAETAGQLEITIYDSTILETPGEPIHKLTRDLAPEDLSNGKDGRWVVEDLIEMKPVKGIIWIGVHKTGGTPTIWASSVVSGQAFVRNNDPTNPMSLLPTKRTPMLRLEISP
jgi:hypothetical protein